MTSDQILAACPLFARVQGPSRDRLLRMAQPKQFAKGERIADDGQDCPGVYVIGQGLVRIYKLSPNGKEHVLHLAGTRETFLEVASILGMNSPAFVEAIEDTTTILLPNDAFRRALLDDHQLCLQLLGGMAMRVKQFVHLLEDIVLRDAISRVARHLLNLSQEQGQTVNLPSFKKHLASHLNLTSETLSRCLRQLIDGQIIQTEEGGAIRVLDRQALEEVAEGMYPRL
jgi:CRP/FNR family transcriptional regulator, dissimilatory nitrate respiration regulator